MFEIGLGMCQTGREVGCSAAGAADSPFVCSECDILQVTVIIWCELKGIGLGVTRKVMQAIPGCKLRWHCIQDIYSCCNFNRNSMVVWCTAFATVIDSLSLLRIYSALWEIAFWAASICWVTWRTRSACEASSMSNLKAVTWADICVGWLCLNWFQTVQLVT